MVDKFFFLLACGVLNGAAVRMRTQSIFMLVVFFALLTAQFFLFDACDLPSRAGATVLLCSFPLPWVVGRFMDRYVDRNWHLFSPSRKRGVRHLWAYRTAAYLLIAGLLVLCGYAGVGWSKENV